MRIGLSNTDPAARERGVVDFLDSIPRRLKPVLIGGYAVAAYGPPRFSADVDLVLPSSALADARDWLGGQAVRAAETWRRRGVRPPWVKLLVNRELVSGDLYFGGLRERETGALIDYEWLALRTAQKRLVLKTGMTRDEFPVARPEALWVLKLLAGRPQDVTDLFAISNWPVHLTEVGTKIQQMRGKRVQAGLARLAKRLLSDKEYEDALSRRGLGSPSDPRNVALWNKFRSGATMVLRSSTQKTPGTVHE